ncbi:hypothetical protein Tco_1020443 [Tanacetum coccineum]
MASTGMCIVVGGCISDLNMRVEGLNREGTGGVKHTGIPIGARRWYIRVMGEDVMRYLSQRRCGDEDRYGGSREGLVRMQIVWEFNTQKNIMQSRDCVPESVRGKEVPVVLMGSTVPRAVDVRVTDISQQRTAKTRDQYVGETRMGAYSRLGESPMLLKHRKGDVQYRARLGDIRRNQLALLGEDLSLGSGYERSALGRASMVPTASVSVVSSY